MLLLHKGFTKKNGTVKGVQLYKCVHCGKQFLGGNRLDNNVLWEEYTLGKQTYAQLADKYRCSIKTIQRRIDAVQVEIKPPKYIKLRGLMFFSSIIFCVC